MAWGEFSKVCSAVLNCEISLEQAVVYASLVMASREKEASKCSVALKIAYKSASSLMAFRSLALSYSLMRGRVVVEAISKWC